MTGPMLCGLPKRPFLLLAIGGLVAAIGFASWGSIVQAVEEVGDAGYDPEPTCNGFWCGGPFFWSPLAVLLSMFAVFFLVGLIGAAIGDWREARRQ